MSAITVDNDLVHYEVLGRGRPVILLHGWLSSWRYWIPTMQQLSMKYRTYALDLWGYGDSGKDPSRLTLEAHLNLLDTFMNQLGITKAAFVGHSLGAAVMVKYALKYPERAARLMTIGVPVFEADRGAPLPAPQPYNPPPPKPARPSYMKPTIMTRPDQEPTRPQPPSPPPDATRATPPGWNRPTITNRDEVGPLPGSVSGTGNAGSAAPGGPGLTSNPLRARLMGMVPRDLLERYLDRNVPDYDRLLTEAGKTAPTALAASAESFDRIDLALDLRQVRVPTVVIHGEEDLFVPPPSGALAGYLSHEKDDFRCVVWPGAKHFPMLEDPAGFHRLVSDFLEAGDVDDLEFKERWVRKVR